MQTEKSTFNEFREIIKRLRSENGCPWDKKQTHDSLKQYLIEECYEVIDAINKKSNEHLCEELGDVLLQVMLHSQIAEEFHEFDVDDVIEGVSKKMILRHPHVFGDVYVKDAEEVKDNWDEIKKKEKGYATDMEIIESIPESLPALLRSYKVQKKVKKMEALKQLDKTSDECINDIYEELEQLRDNMAHGKKEIEEINIRRLYGKVLYDIVKLGCEMGVNPEISLTDETDREMSQYKSVINGASGLQFK